MENEAVRNIFVNYLIASPSLIVWFVGAVLAVVFWRRHPKTSAVALLGFGLGLFVAFIYGFAFHLLSRRLSAAGLPYDEHQTYYYALRAVLSLVEALAAALVVAAVFAWRKPRA